MAALPQELIDNITQYAEHSDLSRLSMTCRAVRAAVFPQLFKNISIVWGRDGEEQSQYATQQKVASLRISSLVWVLLGKPGLASLVQSIRIEFKTGNSRRTREKWVQTAMPKSTLHTALFGPAMEGVGSRKQRMWARIVEKNGLDGLALLFISICPKLEYLNLGLDYLRENDYSEEENDDSEDSDELVGEIDSPNEDDSESEIDSLDEEDQQLSSRTRLAGLRNLPFRWARALRRFRQTQFWAHLTKSDVFVRASSLAMLKTLQLHDTELPPTCLQKSLRHMTSLQTLTYGYYLHVDDKGLNCEELQSALNLVKSTLKQLTITCRFFSENEKTRLREYEGAFVSGHCTFKDFPQLHYLHVNPEILLGWHHDEQPEPDTVLPPVLDTLSWRADYAEYIDSDWHGANIEWWLDDFIRSGRYRAYTPHWKRFVIWNVWSHKSTWIDHEEETYLRILCATNEDQVIELDILYSWE